LILLYVYKKNFLATKNLVAQKIGGTTPECSPVATGLQILKTGKRAQSRFYLQVNTIQRNKLTQNFQNKLNDVGYPKYNFISVK